MLFNEGMGLAVGNWSKSLLPLIYKYLSPHLYNISCAFFKLLISHGRSEQILTAFPSFDLLAFQVTHACHIIARSLEISILSCRSGNWDPDDFAKEWCLLSWVNGKVVFLAQLSVLYHAASVKMKSKRQGFVRLKFKLGFLLSKDRFEL